MPLQEVKSLTANLLKKEKEKDFLIDEFKKEKFEYKEVNWNPEFFMHTLFMDEYITLQVI